MPHGFFVLDVDRCTGCSACSVACTNENPVSAGLSWREIHTYNTQRLPWAPVFHYSLACNHCLDPACMAGCPANAYRKSPETGSVLIDPDRCIGCRYCSWVCPYDAPQYSPLAGIMEKCTFCNHRQQDGLEPACVVACPMEALTFETEAEATPVDRPGFPETGLRPAIKILGRRRESPPPTTLDPALPHLGPSPSASLGWNGLRNEWSLWLFSAVATLLVAWFISAAAGHTPITLPLFAAVGSISMATSALHLGRMTRFWRAIANIRNSWVSREVALYSAFFAGACLLEMGNFPRMFHWWVAGLGLSALFAMDMVYRVPGQPVSTVPHSGMATLTVAYYLGILIGSPALALPVAATKAVLYVARENHPQPGRVIWAVLRVGIGLVVPSVLMAARMGNPELALAAAVFGELIDRAEFYASLRFLTPAVQIDRDLAVRSS